MTEPALAFDDVDLFGPEARRSPDMEAVWAWLVEQDAGLPNWLDLQPAEARRQHNRLAMRWNATLPEVDRVEPVQIPGTPPMACRLLVPPDATPGCILFLHGGGWAFGDVDTYDRFMRLLAIAARRRVLGIEYRLAPEHPYPAPLDDCRAAWAWLAGRPRADLVGPLSVAGDSAGANLAMALMLAAARDGTAMPGAALLFYGAYQAGGTDPSFSRFAEGFGLTRVAMSRFWQMYAAEAALREDPLASALQAPDAWLRQLPALFLNAAGLDPLLSDTLALVKRLQLIGVNPRFALHPGVHHGFMQMSLRLPEAQLAITQAGRFLAEHN